VLLFAVPVVVTTEIGPVVAPGGTVAERYASDHETLENGANIPLNFKAVTPEKLPWIVIRSPACPEVGENERMAGTGVPAVTVKLVKLVTDPVVNTWTNPVVAPEGTMQTTVLESGMVQLVLAPLKLAEAYEDGPKLPWKVTLVPTFPLEGLKLVIESVGAVMANDVELTAKTSGAV
jgi:hypothetical protein